MEKPHLRPEDKPRRPALYEIVIKEHGSKPRFTGMRFQPDFLEYMKKRIYPPFQIVPIIFEDAPSALDLLREETDHA